ncbi:MAG: carboxymuconolactone decarboxylase family protein [Deltaproteobacteria bacterium]|nr:carboxymuconolactone decarboxylase family protein [Deltaproteobacteria bacterium]
MPRFPYAHEGEEAEAARPFYAAIKEKFGMVPNLVKLVGHSGPATEALVQLLDIYTTKLALPARIREIAYLTAAKANGCGYCTAHHTRLALGAGLTEAQIAALPSTDGLFTHAEEAVALFALETTRAVAASDEAVAHLREHFAPKLVAEIAFVVAAANFIQRIGRNFGVELEG